RNFDPKVFTHGIERPRHHEKSERKTGEGYGKRKLVRGLLAHRSLDEGYHTVEERLARASGYANFNAVRQDARTARNARSVAPRLPHNRGGFSGYGGFVDGCHTFYYLAVVGYHFARGYDHDVPLPELIRA